MISAILELEEEGKNCDNFIENCCKDRDCKQRNCLLPRCCTICPKVDYCVGICEFLKTKCRCHLKEKRWENVLKSFDDQFKNVKGDTKNDENR
ncbi:MAG: hypothetical protein WC346_04735 [Methanogenium sp.]|jgi:hypothetical protein